MFTDSSLSAPTGPSCLSQIGINRSVTFLASCPFPNKVHCIYECALLMGKQNGSYMIILVGSPKIELVLGTVAHTHTPSSLGI